MINQLITFATNHWELVAVFVAILITLIFNETKGGPKGVSTSTATTMMNNDEAIVLDIRPEKEFKTGHITGAINIPSDKIKSSLNKLEKHKDKAIIVACKTGMNSNATAKELNKAGVTKVFKLKGGITEWQTSNLPLVKTK
ncbi:Thiosulfate sulfurtransferase GlpE [Marinomonas spartinae]|uniref:Thiosulfate sulfurtransferase GlpE n=1 Tax=Marinomonas spartinae TaxID=1792290 RepID=A0A1A8T679_9GAMM|nr:rhodanese-like domain-containing protein [Marinomonas spartinae]SBS26804.1 Thiosulfate sulfurtransferase GlpE [Marinomonas spartinae]SBS40322.1 Thiosulfate sulfurtransferase GlpE [Marinomonas spartinae]